MIVMETRDQTAIQITGDLMAIRTNKGEKGGGSCAKREKKLK